MTEETERTDDNDNNNHDNDNDNNNHDNDNDNNNHDNGGRRAGMVRLSELIDQVGDALREASQKDLEDRDKPVMRFKECQIEAAVEVEKEVGGGISVWIFDLQASQTKTSTNTIRVTFERLPAESVVETVVESDVEVEDVRQQ